MSNTIYITAFEAHSGKSAVALGVMELLVRNLDKVAFFRPIINKNGSKGYVDDVINLISYNYDLKIPHEMMYAYTFEEARSLVAEGRHEVLMEGILDKYKAVSYTHLRAHET